MTRPRVRWLALGIVGVALLVPFKAPATLAGGILCLLGFVAWGVWLIATPAFTGADEPE